VVIAVGGLVLKLTPARLPKAQTLSYWAATVWAKADSNHANKIQCFFMKMSIRDQNNEEKPLNIETNLFTFPHSIVLLLYYFLLFQQPAIFIANLDNVKTRRQPAQV